MNFHYYELWKLLINKNMKKTNLIVKIVNPVFLSVIGKINEELGADIGDLICIDKYVEEDKWHLR